MIDVMENIKKLSAALDAETGKPTSFRASCFCLVLRIACS